jgi:choline dehydrogenase-like flavoprotein
MSERERFDVLVVAGGKGGKTLAMDLAKTGRQVAMVERVPEMIGGTCINLACIPTKTLIRSAEDRSRRAKRRFRWAGGCRSRSAGHGPANGACDLLTTDYHDVDPAVDGWIHG